MENVVVEIVVTTNMEVAISATVTAKMLVHGSIVFTQRVLILTQALSALKISKSTSNVS